MVLNGDSFMGKRAVWLSLVASGLLHLLLVVLAEPFWSEVDDAEAFRTRFAYRPRFEPRRLGALRPKPAPASRMERLRPEAAPDHTPDPEPPPLPRAIPASIPQQVFAQTAPSPGVRPDTLALAAEVMPSADQYGWHDIESGDTAMDLMRIEDMARADAYRAAIIPSPNGPRDSRGYINFTPLNLYGTGSGRQTLEYLARYMRDYTGILAQVRPQRHRHFLSERLLEDPVHFLFQNGGMPGWSDDKLTNFSEEEKSLLGRYLGEGGFLVIGSEIGSKGRRYKKEMIDLLCGVMGQEGRISPLPASHPINHSYHHFDSFPGRFVEVYEELDLCSANLLEYTYSGDPYGATLGGKLVAIIDGAGHTNWGGNSAESDSTGAEPGDTTLLSLARGVNIISYVLHRTDGPVLRRELPAWEGVRPAVALGKHPEDAEPETWTDIEVIEQLDASLALVHTPMGESIVDGMRLRLDDTYDFDVNGNGTNALLMHNLKSGVHHLELHYRGESRRLEVNLIPDQVTTLTFSLKNFVIFQRLVVAEREERLYAAHWLESFRDLSVDERFSSVTMAD
jgi:hypothetical protein